MSVAVHAARRAVEAARVRLTNRIRRDYPVDAAIAWTSGRSVCRGVVVMHCYGERIKVRNSDTGKELFIHAWRITRCTGR